MGLASILDNDNNDAGDDGNLHNNNKNTNKPQLLVTAGIHSSS